MSQNYSGLDTTFITPLAPTNTGPNQAQVPTYIPPPASSTVITNDSVDFNDEVFFHHAKYTGEYQPSPMNEYYSARAGLVSNLSSPTSSLPGLKYSDLQTNSTTPEFPSPPEKALAFQDNYAYQQPDLVPVHRPGHGHTHSFSLPIDQLNLLSLKPFSSHNSQLSRSPSPEYFGAIHSDDTIEERTINPRELLNALQQAITDQHKRASGVLDWDSSTPKNYVLPSSVSSPSLTTLFKNNDIQKTPKLNKYRNKQSSSLSSASSSADPVLGFDPFQMLQDEGSIDLEMNDSESTIKPSSQLYNANLKFDFNMNDECFNAISFWLNNTTQVINKMNTPASSLKDINEDGSAEILINPTGIMKPSYYKRRNSIQVINQSGDAHAGLKAEVAAAKEELNDFELNNTTTTLVSAGQKKKRRKSYNLDASKSSLGSSGLLSGNTSANSYGNASLGASNSLSRLDDGEYANHAYFHRRTSSESTSPMTTTILKQPFKFDLPSIGSKPSTVEEEEETYHQDQKPQVGLSKQPQMTSSRMLPDQLNDDNEPKPFPCPHDHCTKQFKRSEHLKRHIRSVHSNIRPFHCRFCEKKFSRSDNLAQHLKTHYRLNPNGTTSIIYGNPNLNNRGGRKSSKGQSTGSEVPED